MIKKIRSIRSDGKNGFAMSLLLNRSGNEVVSLVGSLSVAARLAIAPAHWSSSVEATASGLETTTTAASVVAISC